MIHPWITVSFFIFSIISALSTGADPSSQNNIQEAFETIGKFLKDGGGPNWLSNLVINQSAPLTTEDLVKEILDSTIANDTVKQAANVIKSALDEQKQPGSNNTQVLEFEGWKDLIDNVQENEEIVCLYRKSFNITSERTEDWKKFMKNISRNYTLYLALDMGQKYVICLKKINLPDRNITNRDSDINEAATHSIEPPNNHLIVGERQLGNGSRSLNLGEKLLTNDNDKCDSSDMQAEHDHESRNMPAYSNNARRILPTPTPTPSPDTPCNRPIILMAPPNYQNYMVPMGGYYMPYWMRNGYPIIQNAVRPPVIQNYIPGFIPQLNPSAQHSVTTENYSQIFDFGRKRLPVKPITSQSQEVVDDKNVNVNLNLNQQKFSVPNSQEKLLKSSSRITPSPIHHPKYLLPQTSQRPLLRPYYPLWQSPVLPFNPTFKPENSMLHPPPLSQQPGHMRPEPSSHYHPPTTALPSPMSSHPNCMPCPNPCDRPILLKVVVEKPVNQIVKVGLMPNGDSLQGRRQMSEGSVENEMGNLKDEKNFETAEGN